MDDVLWRVGEDGLVRQQQSHRMMERALTAALRTKQQQGRLRFVRPHHKAVNPSVQFRAAVACLKSSRLATDVVQEPIPCRARGNLDDF